MAKDNDLILLRRRQGHAWIARLADLDGWSEAREDQAQRELDACPPACLDDEVERWRSAMWAAMVRHGDLPCFERTAGGQPIAPPAPHPSKPRGLAQHLAHAPAPHAGRQDDLFPSDE